MFNERVWARIFRKKIRRAIKATPITMETAMIRSMTTARLGSWLSGFEVRFLSLPSNLPLDVAGSLPLLL